MKRERGGGAVAAKVYVLKPGPRGARRARRTLRQGKYCKRCREVIGAVRQRVPHEARKRLQPPARGRIQGAPMRQGILQDGRRHGEAQGQQPKKEEKKIKRKRAHDEWKAE